MSASSQVGAVRDDLDDEDVLSETFEQLQREAESAIVNLSPEEVLVPYFPPATSRATASDATTLPSNTPPTSMSIHNEAAADVSDDATQASTEEATLLWGMGTVFGSSSEPLAAQSKRAVRTKRLFVAPAFMELPPWVRVGFIVVGMLTCTLALLCLRLFVTEIALPSFTGVSPPLHQNATFQSTYFHTLNRSLPWLRPVLLVNGAVWLSSLYQLVRSFQRLLDGKISNRVMQISLLKNTFVWLAYSGIDGILRLRSREEISISMMTILMLMLFLSTSARNLANPVAA